MLGLKAEIDLFFSLLPLVLRRSKHGLYFSIISAIHQSITPSLQYSRYDQPPPLIKRGWLVFTNGCDLHPCRSNGLKLKTNWELLFRLWESTKTVSIFSRKPRPLSNHLIYFNILTVTTRCFIFFSKKQRVVLVALKGLIENDKICLRRAG